MRFDHKSHLASFVARRSEALKDKEILQKAHQLILDLWQNQADEQLQKVPLDNQVLHQRKSLK